MIDILLSRLQNAFNLTTDLVDSLSEEHLKLKLTGMPSNTIGEQIWCVIGARESYTNAIANKGWVGFSCSLENPHSKNQMKASLKKSEADCMATLSRFQLKENQLEYLLSLLEHEVQHHGQLIRFFYGNKLAFPKSWNQRYTV